MEYMERFKLRLQLAVNDTKAVRLAQTKDHLVWKRYAHDGDGQRHEGNAFVFLLHDGQVIEIFMSENLTQSPYYWDNEEQFLDAVATGYAEEDNN